MHWNIYSLLIAVMLPLFSHQSQSTNDIFEASSSTIFQVNRFRYTWSIKNFSFYGKIFNETLLSPEFQNGVDIGCPWQLEISPSKSSNNSDYLSLSLLYVNPYNCKRISVQYNLGIVNANGKEIELANSSSHQFDYNDPKANHEYFVDHDFLLHEQNGLLQDDTLTIYCEIKSSKSESSKRDLKTDLAFLENQKFSDVTLTVNGTEFKSFKVILSARSSVFKDIFELNPNTTQIEITDVDPIVMKEILRFVYTDEASNVGNLALDLLVAAKKFKLNGLNDIAVNAISAKLRSENAAELYILADTHSSEQLKTKVRDFVRHHTTAVSHSNGFRSMIKTHPKLLIELIAK